MATGNLEMINAELARQAEQVIKTGIEEFDLEGEFLTQDEITQVMAAESGQPPAGPKDEAAARAAERPATQVAAAPADTASQRAAQRPSRKRRRAKVQQLLPSPAVVNLADQQDEPGLASAAASADASGPAATPSAVPFAEPVDEAGPADTSVASVGPASLSRTTEGRRSCRRPRRKHWRASRQWHTTNFPLPPAGEGRGERSPGPGTARLTEYLLPPCGEGAG